jgi:capsular exopolysaccharide synthesis family protein
VLNFLKRRSKHRRVRKEDTSDDVEYLDLSKRLVALQEPMGASSEAYRTLRTNLVYSFVDNPPKVIVLTSSGPQEGKSTTCANLGVLMSQADKSTLIVDCDLRKPVMHKFFRIRGTEGIVDILAGERTLQEVWHEPVPGLKVVPVGRKPPNPAELLGSQRFSEFLASVREEFDYVLVDAPPVGLVTDPAILASQGDGVLIVLDAQRTRKGALRRSIRSLQAVGANVLGAVMDNVPTSEGYYYYSYTYNEDQ